MAIRALALLSVSSTGAFAQDGEVSEFARKAFPFVLELEGPPTEKSVDGHVTLFGITAAALTDHSQFVLGRKYTKDEIEEFLRLLSKDVDSSTGALKPNIPNGMCGAIEDFRTNKALRFFDARYVKGVSIHKIQEKYPDLGLLLAIMSFNGGPGAVNWIMDKMAHELEGGLYTDPIPAVRRQRFLFQGKRPVRKTAIAGQSIAQRLLAVMENHKQSKEVGFEAALKLKLVETIALYYVNILDLSPKNIRFFRGWIKKRVEESSSVVLGSIKPLKLVDCNRPIEAPRPPQDTPYTISEYETVTMAQVCTFQAYTIVEFNGGLIPIKTVMPPQALPWASKEMCEKLGGKFSPEQMFINGMLMMSAASCPPQQPAKKGKAKAAPSAECK